MKICLPFCTSFINLISHFVCLETSNINYNVHLFLFRKKNETVVILYKKKKNYYRYYKDCNRAYCNENPRLICFTLSETVEFWNFPSSLIFLLNFEKEFCFKIV